MSIVEDSAIGKPATVQSMAETTKRVLYDPPAHELAAIEAHQKAQARAVVEVSPAAFREFATPSSDGTLLAMSPDEKAAHLEFREAAREARATAEAAQRAAKRYQEAIKRLSEVCAPPTRPDELP